MVALGLMVAERVVRDSRDLELAVRIRSEVNIVSRRIRFTILHQACLERDSNQ